MPRRVLTIPTSDFRGGINYNADAFQLDPNQVSDAMNVDFDPNGGFARRGPVTLINATALASTPRNIWSFNSSDGTYKHILVQDGNDAAYSTGGNFTSINPDATATTGVMFAATANDKCYVQRNAEQVVWTWDGTAAATIADSHGAYNDNLAAPVGGKMPKAKYITRHQNYLFHANINEGGVQRRDRLRYSHPFSDLTGTKGVEDYRTNDWIPVGPGDGDEITGIASWGHELIIFKNNSVWRLTGYGPDSWVVDNVSRTVGAVGQRAIAIGDEGVYFFSWPNGLQLYDGSKVADLWYPLNPLTDPNGVGTLIGQNAFDNTQISKIAVGYVRQRVWVSACMSGSSTNDLTFVFDPRLGKHGGWTQYNTQIAAFLSWHPPSTDRHWYGVYAGGGATGRVLELHGPSINDSINATDDTPIAACVYTRWFDEGNPALEKRWKHPIMVCDADSDVTLRVETFRDYNFNNVVRSFEVPVTSPPTGMLWGTGVWGTGTWGGTVTGAQSIEKGGLLGRGTSVAAKVCGPLAADVPWGVNSITWKYIPRRIRS